MYDDWNLIRESTTRDSGESTESYVWGLDLSGSLQGAGGIGGLLLRKADTGSFLYLYDANGNVGQLVNAADGALAAHYEYDPFGNTIVANGSEASSNPFRFSTKSLDTETGQYYYGYRYYSPELGRWINRDPMGEQGGLNLYGFVRNTPLNGIDILGLATIVIDPGHGDVTDKSGGTTIDPGVPHPTDPTKNEKDQALALALAIGGELQRLGHTIKYTRTSDLDDGIVRKYLEWRVDFISNANADYAVSVHIDSYDPAAGNYVKVKYHKGNPVGTDVRCKDCEYHNWIYCL